MATRDLETNSLKALNKADRIVDFTSKELIKSYKKALVEIRARLTGLYERFLTLAEPTGAQLTQFMRLSNIEKEIVEIMRPYLTANEAFIKDMSVLGVDNGYFNNAWAIDQATGVNLGWGVLDDTAVRVAAGISGDSLALEGIMSASEIKKHKKLLDDAFKNYDADTIKWISQDIRQGIIQGESAAQVSRRIRNSGITKSYNSAMKISRTEILRATGVSGQLAYDEARGFGVNINEIWDATLDGSTRPDHAIADGKVKDNLTGLFTVPWGTVSGPRRSGIASQDIQCRCYAVDEVEGYSPELRFIRGQGLQPYQTFKQWALDNNITANRFGQKYNFKVAA